MTDLDLIEFLEARLAEDEAAARATLIDVDGSGDWRADDQPVIFTVDLYRVRDVNARPVVEAIKSLYGDEGPAEPLYVDGEAIAAHIARHDPARVLREVEAKRKLLGRFRRATILRSHPGGKKVGDKYHAALAPVLEVLATAYSDHPDYREKWLDSGASNTPHEPTTAPDSPMDPFEAADDTDRRWE